MDSYEADLQRRVDEAVAANDLAALDSLLREHYEKADAAERPFDAAIQLRPQYQAKLADTGLESDAAFTWANRIARAKRRVAYRLKIAHGFNGLRIVSEGDSWWQYPLLLEDVIDQLSGDADKAIYSVCAAGDLVERMAREKQYILALEESGADVMLLSGGGNDLLGDGALQKLLVKYAKGKKPGSLLNAAKLKSTVSSILGHYSTILHDLQTRFPKVQVFGHAYDLPNPVNGGKWLGGPLKKAGIPVSMWRDVIGVLLDRFSDELKALQLQFPNFHFVDLRGKVDQGESSWYDELHPTNSGFARAAQEFRSAIAAEVGAFGIEAFTPRRGVARVATRSAFEAGTRFEAAGAVIVLDPGHGGSPPPNKIGGSSWNNAVGPNGTLEKTLTLDVARRARDQLRSRGHTVLLTRDGDNNLSLAKRAGVAKTNNAPVFVSIHFNASTGHNAQGTETFVHTSHNAVSRRLCLAVQASMVAALGLSDRNASHPGRIKQAALGVLRPGDHASATACVLHEVSFLDRADEEAKLQSDAYRDRIAKALAQGIETYLGTGVEFAVPLAEEGEIGDAIELASLEAGDLSVLAPVAPAAEAIDVEYGELGYVRGYALPDEGGVADLYEERKPAASEDFIRQVLEGEERFRAARTTEGTDESSNDRREFEHVDIGDAPDFSSLGVSFESDVATLRQVFANVESTGFDLPAFEAFINSLGLEHFSPAQFLVLGASNAPGAACSGRNTVPPRELWPRIANTAKMLDEIRRRLGASVRILSCYRSPAYNTCIGGERGSLHMKFNAIDWRCSAGDVHLWHRTAKEVRSANPNFLGGIGLYVGSRFIHIDTRGQAANW